MPFLDEEEWHQVLSLMMNAAEEIKEVSGKS